MPQFVSTRNGLLSSKYWMINPSDDVRRGDPWSMYLSGADVGCMMEILDFSFHVIARCI